MIIIEESFLGKKECEYLIELHSRYFDKFGYQHRDTKVINFHPLMELSPIILDVLSKIDFYVKTIDETAYIALCELVEWPVDSYQGEHYDFNYNFLTSIIYLNDNFDGGKTVIENNIVEPKIGKMVTFTGNKLKHKVTPVHKNNRFTIPIWYKKTND